MEEGRLRVAFFLVKNSRSATFSHTYTAPSLQHGVFAHSICDALVQYYPTNDDVKLIDLHQEGVQTPMLDNNIPIDVHPSH